MSRVLWALGLGPPIWVLLLGLALAQIPPVGFLAVPFTPAGGVITTTFPLGIP